MKAGERIKELRKQKKITLAKLSEQTGLSASSLSRIENTLLSLTNEKMLKISEALGVEISEIVPAKAPATAAPDLPSNSLARQVTSYRRDREFVAEDNTRACYLFSELKKKNMDVVLVEVDPLPIEDTEFIRHSGEKSVYVIKGKLEVHFEYYSPKVLEQGDAIYFDSDMWHSVTALNGKKAEILVTYFYGTDNTSSPSVEGRKGFL
ncbi:helix-turn-helix domain-containing protein [Pseudomaricurvus alkylphenolicus]|uniref:helix-turn-helix domain-containing protein n=1 Tax=Pseudomaricurvus alkylphenolicus TaxID=1306991 RepID=UPI0014244662|nr:XRE family transcriptional regulator [Pseudomaricurvus alkylphenolicus]NIB38453.1 helix-turn-helix domain-containing protein [Pseudomaricurvus alkylphenolicus]